MNRKKTQFGLSAELNNLTFQQYFNRLFELSISMFEWKNLPDTVDARYLETALFEDGCAVFFQDDVTFGHLALSCLQSGSFDIYGNPVTRRAYSRYNNYQQELTDKNSIIIYNNYMRKNSVLDVRMFAQRLYNIDRIIDVNVNAQKTPVMVQGTEKQRLTLLNLYKQYDGNEPFIFADKSLDLNVLKVLRTDAPYLADKLFQLKTQIWNEALTYLGISNVSVQKKERLITDEVARSQGGTVASRYSRLQARRDAAEKINDMFGLSISVDFREDFVPEAEGGEADE